MASFFDRFRKRAEQIAKGDWGGTTVNASSVQPKESQDQGQSMEWKLKNAKYGKLANNPELQKQVYVDSQRSKFNPVTAGIKSAVAAPVTVGKGIGGAVVNTAQLPYSATRLASANLSGNKTAAENARKAVSSDARNNLVWNDTFNRAADVMSSAATARYNLNRNAQANNEVARRISSAYGDTPMARNYADMLKSQLANEDANRILNRQGLDQNSSKAQVAMRTGLPIVSAAAQVGLNAAGLGAGGNVINQAANQITRQVVNEVGKQGLKYGTANAGIGIADTLAAGGSAQDAVKAGTIGLAAGMIMPVAGAAARAVGNKATARPQLPKDMLDKRNSLIVGYNRAMDSGKTATANKFAQEIARIDKSVQSPVQRVKSMIAPKPLGEGGYVRVPGKQEKSVNYRSAHQIDSKTARNLGDIKNIDDVVYQVRSKYGLTGFDQKDIANLKKVIGNPNADVKIYRASPVNEINDGDWVTTSRTYAQDIKRQNGGKVYEYTVKAKDLSLPANIEDNPSLARFAAFQYKKATAKNKLFNLGEGGGRNAPRNQAEADALFGDRGRFSAPNAEDRVFRFNPLSPEFQARVREFAEQQKPTIQKLNESTTVPKRDASTILGRKLTEAEDAALRAYAETKDKAAAIKAYEDVYIYNGKLYGGEARAAKNVERVIKAQETADAPVFAKVKQADSGSSIPVMRQTQSGDVVTATNVNPSIKARERRYSVDDNGNLVDDTNGAYHLFSDDDGKVTGFRVGDEYFSSKDLGDLSTVNDYSSTLATMRRNIERAFDDGNTGEKVNQFLVEHQQGQATKLIDRQVKINKDLKQIQKELGIDFKIGRRDAKRVSAAIQNYGEGNLTKQQLVTQFGAERAAKIVAADKWFRAQYNLLLDEMNSTLTKFGYDPVPKRKNYYTHFQDANLWKRFGLKMQEIRNMASPTMQDAMPEAARGKISNKLAGESEFLQPNKQFNRFALERTGGTYTPDAFGAFERYLNPTLNNIYMTPSISRARVLAKAMAQEADLAGKDANGILIQVKEWANSLAGKSNRFMDRQMSDSRWGRGTLKALGWVQKKAGQNSIVGNLNTAIMQPIVLGQTTGKFGIKNTILGIMQEIYPAHTKNAPIRQSAFMRRRYADLRSTTGGKMDALRGAANKPLEVVEETAARITWNAAYNDALSNGMKGSAAIRYADINAEKTLAGRSIGEKPEIFRSKAMGVFSMYQLEVNNFWQQFGKEMVLGNGASGKAQAARTMAAMYALNLVLQEVTGRQIGFNPIDSAIDTYQDWQNDEKTQGEKIKSAFQRTAGEFIDNSPFTSNAAATLFGDDGLKGIAGNDSNAGRFGASSPFSAIATTTNIAGVPVPLNAILPFGGSQVKKTIEGIQTLRKGGVDDKNGNRMVDVPPTTANTVKGVVFGKNAIPEVNQYNNNLGKSKVDQKQVQNQGNSRAASMGKAGDGDKPSDIYAAAFGTPEGKAMLKLDTDKEREEQYPALYKQYKSMKKALEGDKDTGKPDNYDSLGEDVKKFYDKQAALTPEAKDKWVKDKADDKAKPLIESMSKWLPEGMPALPQTNAVAKLYAEYEAKKQKDGNWAPLRENAERVDTLRKAYATALADNEMYYIGLNDTDTVAAIDSGELTKEMLDKLIAHDDLIVKLDGKQQISNTLRRKLGYQTTKSGRSGGKKKSSINYSNLGTSNLVNTRVANVKYAPVKKPTLKTQGSTAKTKLKSL